MLDFENLIYPPAEQKHLFKSRWLMWPLLMKKNSRTKEYAFPQFTSNDSCHTKKKPGETECESH